MNRNSKNSKVVFGCMVVIMLILSIMYDDASLSAFAQPPTVTPSATRTVGGFSTESSQDAEGVHRSAILTSSWYNYSDPCEDLPIVTSPTTAVWLFSPRDSIIALNDPNKSDETQFVVVQCSGEEDPNTTYTVQIPNGQEFSLERRETSFSPSWYYLLAEDSQIGDYIVTIHKGSEILTRTYTVEAYDGPKLTVSDNVTGIKVGEAPINHPLRIEYAGFLPNSIVTTVLYKLDIGQFDLINSWKVTVDSNGAYAEVLKWPVDLKLGSYHFVACTVENCTPIFENNDFLINTVGERIHLTPSDNGGPVVRQSIVDPVIAWNGVILKDDPNGVRIAGLAANRSLTVLGVPVTANDGTEWIEVEDDASGRRGWVQARYVLFDTIENTYVNLYWTPGCNPQRPEVQLFTVDGQPCASGARYMSLDDFADELRTINLLRQEEWIEPVATGGHLNESLRIRTASDPRVGWLKIGTANPLSQPSLVGAVWRTPYSSNTLVGSVCWWRMDGEWLCENR